MTETHLVWIKELKKGNELAAFNLYNSYSSAMYSTLIRLTNDAEIAKDLLQEAFVKAFNKISTLDDPKAFGGWLKRIVLNTGLEYLRKTPLSFTSLNDEDDISEPMVDEQLIDNATLHHAIRELPDGCRTVLCLFLLEDQKHKDIAEILGISESTSKTQYKHAKALLKKKLAHYYEN